MGKIWRFVKEKTVPFKKNNYLYFSCPFMHGQC